MSTSRAYAAASAIAALALLAAGCGGETRSTEGKVDKAESQSSFGRQTVAQIRTATATDMANISSVTISGDVPSQELKFTVSVDSDSNCVGEFELSDGKASVIEVEHSSFVMGDLLFWNATIGPEEASQRAALGDGVWLRSPRKAGSFLPQCDFRTFVPALLTGDSAAATKGKETEVGGVPAIAITSDEDGVTSTAWISTGAPHYLLKLTTEGGNDAGTFTLSDFDEPVDASLPADAKVIDLAPTREAE